jgi:uncharacterized protein (TIGR02569 family)
VLRFICSDSTTASLDAADDSSVPRGDRASVGGRWQDDAMAGDSARSGSADSPDAPRLHTAADRRRLAAGPTPRSVVAFGVDERRLAVLPGGQGQTWSDGRVVLKSTGFEPERRWVCEVYAGWTAHDVVRVPEPVPARGSAGADAVRWVVDGWTAHVYVPGRDAVLPAEIGAVHEASRLFHAAVSALDRPGWLDDRNDPWAHGDRLAWEAAAPIATERERPLVERLTAALAPVESPSQVIHGDVLPNVLLADGRPPAVIDWPPYWRPSLFADAIAVTDAVTFRGAAMSLLDEWAAGPDWQQLLIRALLYRLGPTGFFAARDSLMGSLVTHVERVSPVVDAVLARGR